ncbi:MAG: PQQ-like beta-propeller repeat protein [Clostridiaceae bacterium]|nr:PQQ-like beta-propeller repeat protein [Clostridiaceae bacterium]
MNRYKRNKSNRLVTVVILLAVTLLVLLGLLFAQGNLGRGIIADSPTPPLSSPSTPGDTNNSVPTTEPTTTPEPTPPPEITDPEQLVLDIAKLPSFVSKTTVSEGTYQKKFSDGGAITYSVYKNDKKVDYKPEYTLAFPRAKAYTEQEGVTTFRGNNYRDTASYGTRDIKEKKLEIIWEHGTGAISAHNSYWPGSGWTGQPILIHWPEATRNVMNLNSEFKNKDLTEVIYPILDGNIYFLDLETGKPTRNKINLGFSIKGTGMVDPRGYPLFYTGMGLNENNGKLTEFKYRAYSLLDQKEIFSIMGRDSLSYRGKWGAFDSSAVLNKETDTLINVGENGLIYKTKLNTRFDVASGTLSMSPEVTKFQYKSSYNNPGADYGIENSPAIYRNLMYTIDNGGTLLCLDINKLEPVWMYDIKDDTDSTIVLEETENGVFIYTANEVDKRCAGGKASKADCNIRKFNALSGELLWQKDYTCYYRSGINGGVLGTPLIGKDDIADRIIFPVCFTGSQMDGKLVALDKKTGDEIWVRELTNYSWSSPVDIKSDDGKTYGLLCGYDGFMRLFDSITGEDLDKVSLGANIESSPSVYNDIAVVGSYAQKIFGVRIK